MVRAVLDLQPRAKYICGCNTLFNACVGQITSPQRMIRSLVMIRYGPATAILTNLFFKLSCSWQQIRIRKNLKPQIPCSQLQNLRSCTFTNPNGCRGETVIQYSYIECKIYAE